jgi:hypothetical protein
MSHSCNRLWLHYTHLYLSVLQLPYMLPVWWLYWKWSVFAYCMLRHSKGNVYVVHADGAILRLWTAANRPIVYSQTIYEYGEPRWNDIDSGNRRAQRKTCPLVTLSTTNPTWTDPGFCGVRPPEPWHGLWIKFAQYVLKIMSEHSVSILPMCECCQWKHDSFQSPKIKRWLHQALTHHIFLRNNAIKKEFLQHLYCWAYSWTVTWFC